MLVHTTSTWFSCRTFALRTFSRPPKGLAKGFHWKPVTESERLRTCLHKFVCSQIITSTLISRKAGKSFQYAKWFGMLNRHADKRLQQSAYNVAGSRHIVPAEAACGCCMWLHTATCRLVDLQRFRNMRNCSQSENLRPQTIRGNFPGSLSGRAFQVTFQATFSNTIAVFVKTRSKRSLSAISTEREKEVCNCLVRQPTYRQAAVGCGFRFESLEKWKI